MSTPSRLESLICRALSVGESRIEVHGTTSVTAVAYALSYIEDSELLDRAHVVILPDEVAVDDFAEALRFFNPAKDVSILPGYDVSPYSGIAPNRRPLLQRINWYVQAQNGNLGAIYATTLAALLQKSMPPGELKKHTYQFKKGDVWSQQMTRTLKELGYSEVPQVEEYGQYSSRGGIFDVFSTAHENPVRIELFGDQIESLRFFDRETQRSLADASYFQVTPAREVLYTDDVRQELAKYVKKDALERNVKGSDLESVLQDISLGRYFPGLEFLIGSKSTLPASPLSHFQKAPLLWIIDEIETLRAADSLRAEMKQEFDSSTELIIRPPPDTLFDSYDAIADSNNYETVRFYKVKYSSDASQEDASAPNQVSFSTQTNQDLRALIARSQEDGSDPFLQASKTLSSKMANGNSIVISTHTLSQAQRLHQLLSQHGLNLKIEDESSVSWDTWKHSTDLIHILPRPCPDGIRLSEENLIIYTEDDFFSKKQSRSSRKKLSSAETFKALDFGDLKTGDHIVHIDHGVGVFEGLKVMNVGGIASEFIQISYKDGDKLYLPIYRIGQIQKFSGVPTLDKLGGSGWQKTKIKVRSNLRDIAHELLQIYAKRAQAERVPFSSPSSDYRRFEASFLYDETEDQLKSINDVLEDLQKTRPMDRLICGDVGFGKTEVALRAAFKVAEEHRQVVVLVPTTVLAFQHLETFKNRFKGWPIKIAGFSRFTPKEELKQSLIDLREGRVDIAIGTHRLLSKDVSFKNLGLLIVDEEQKFGVVHKEKMRKMRAEVDTIAMTATPIPRTLNLSLVGVRDLSLINTAPRDRLPIRTFISKFEEETVRKAILSEVQRGGQVYYIHNRVQSIYSLADELRALVPEVRIRVAHGQMEEGELESAMVGFFKHEFDVLLCTTIVESGVDIPRANTMIVDRADTFGLSQLYQLRGRIGRSKERAYCYLLVPKTGLVDPDAQERLKILQENTSLGSGFKIAHHDLELRGAGNILGEEQSGNINAVGYELYLELLEDALKAAKGEVVDDKEVEPDLNLKIPALFPDSYMPDIRSRLGYYKALTKIRDISDIDQIEADLRDQFGPPPEQVMNLLGLMLIRRVAKDLGIKDVSAGFKSVSLSFSEKTKVDPKVIIDLSMREKKKYQLLPDSRLIIKTENLSWPAIFEELEKLRKLARI